MQSLAIVFWLEIYRYNIDSSRIYREIQSFFEKPYLTLTSILRITTLEPLTAKAIWLDELGRSEMGGGG